MNTSRDRQTGPAEPPPPGAENGSGRDGLWRLRANRHLLQRMARLTRKELRETLRDRRTVVTLVLMPLLVYPLLSVAFQKFLLSHVHRPNETTFAVAFESEKDARIVFKTLASGDRLLTTRQSNSHGETPGSTISPGDRRRSNRRQPGMVSHPTPDRPRQLRVEPYVHPNVEQCVTDMAVDLGIRLREVKSTPAPGRSVADIDCDLFFRENSVHSEAAVEYVERRLWAVSRHVLQDRLRRSGLTATAANVTRHPLEAESGSPAFSLASLIPFILILMTVTGAVYPAIDLTAGERERGTLEMLIAAPVPRLGLLMAKYVAVLTVALLTATVNLVAMTVTILSVGLGPLLFGEPGLSWMLIVQVFALLILFAGFFSAVLLAVTSIARSFKEAQAYLIPLMLVSLAPGMLSLTPDLNLTGAWAVVPLANIVLLTGDLFRGEADPLLAAVAVTATLLFSVAALAVAAKTFGTDAVLYGSQSEWRDLLRRPQRTSVSPSLTQALLCVALLFPAFVLLGNLLGVSDTGLQTRLGFSVLITVSLFVLFPLLLAWLARVDFRTSLSLRRPRAVSLAATGLLGLSLWPFAYEMILPFVSAGEERIEEFESVLTDVKQMPLAWKLLALALVPAVCEELFFRGYLLSALRTALPAAKAIAVSAVLFGLFHVVVRNSLFLERLIPSTLMGLVLGWVCWRTRSIFPGMLLHGVHNGLFLSLWELQGPLSAFGFGEERSHLPPLFLAVAAVVALSGLALMRHRNNGRPLSGLSGR